VDTSVLEEHALSLSSIKVGRLRKLCRKVTRTVVMIPKEKE
jgi:hypothetical protein